MTAFYNFFSDQLTKDLVWREAEMAVLRKSLMLTISGTPQEQCLLRANVAIVYAHYEGFCKFALNTYIDALKKLQLRRRDLTWDVAAYSMKNFHDALKEKKSQGDFFSMLLDEFNNELDKIAEYESPPEISNLWPDLLISWLRKLGLGYSIIDLNSSVLKSLVDNRNKIAHGKKLTISSRSEFDKYFQVATSAMHEVAIEICDALKNKSYKRHAYVNTIFGHATLP